MFKEIKKEKIIIQYIYTLAFIEQIQKLTQNLAFLESLYLLYIPGISLFFLGKEDNFTYDVQGRIDNVVYPDGEKIIYAYDEGGYLTSIKGSQNYITDIKYNEYGQRTYLKYGNGLETNYTYTKTTGLLDTMTQFKGANELLNYNYDFDLTGNLTKLTDTPNGANISIQNYSYDLLGRISQADGNYKNGTKTYNETYSFDDDNRILEKTFGNGSNYKFNYANKDHAITSIDITGSPIGEKSVEFNYDDFGNMTKKTLSKDSGTSITEFKYDETNKLTEIQLPQDGKKLIFKYDNSGQRIVKEFKDNCTTISKNVYINGFYELVNDAINKHISDGQYIFATKLDNKDENVLYYSQSNIGNTALLTDKEGNKVGAYSYLPYGEIWVEEKGTTDVSAITRFFTNQQYDRESGLYFMNARYYDAHIGSFISPDPAFANLNHYAYCSANPIKYTDPTGLTEITASQAMVACGISSSSQGHNPNNPAASPSESGVTNGSNGNNETQVHSTLDQYRNKNPNPVVQFDPKDKKNFGAYPNDVDPKKQFCTEKTRNSLNNFWEKWFKPDKDGNPTVHINTIIKISHISYEKGGPLPKKGDDYSDTHVSHQEWRDIDIKLYKVVDGEEIDITTIKNGNGVANPNLDTKLMEEFVRTIVSLGVEKVYYNLESVQGQYGKKVEAETGHDNHLHVRFYK
jgi:RHS repeat-associated protein